ncbi:hypothetical protein RM345_002813 [Enterobacter cloacae]|uniref:hypothetical protein n=1 Tax=Enterobacter cloacae TaxID=550 RepID=UPI00062C5D78|nr:hypothetical protein [Enterobacter cloacae]ELE9013841.1 hypothetical protein [Enterobacter cloacae]KKY84092.1 hypothetical protein OA44_05905 [Enterobacter cloacae]MDR9931442.1 hypothetical protein [Enterobacter cloacae subsp. dissolvens]
MNNSIDVTFLHTLMARSNSTQYVQIKDIRSKQARNYLRGVDSTSYNMVNKALKKIKLNCSYNDFKKAVDYVKASPDYEDNDIGQLFNARIPKGLQESVEYSLGDIFKTMDSHVNELSLLMECCVQIYKSLSENKLQDALEFCSEMIDNRGASAFIIRMISFITNRYQMFDMDDKQILGKVDSLKNRIAISNNPALEGAVIQLSNLRTSHLAICKRINDLKDDSYISFIAKSFINPIPRDYESFIKTLNAYYSISLIDAFLYYQVVSHLNLPYVKKIAFSKDLEIIYNEFSQIEFDPSIIYSEVDEDTGYYYLRESFLFVEQSKALRFLVIHGHYYGDFNTKRILPEYSLKLINKYFEGLSNLSQLKCSKMEHVQINWEKYDSSNCGMLENSSALLHLISKKQGRLNDEEQILFVKLMTYSRDVGEACPFEYLETISEEAHDSLLKLVVQCLITINTKSHYTEYQLRSTIQEYCISHFEGDLIKLLEHLYEVSPAVTEHLILICNETFLSTLFILMDRPVDALQARADMLHWFGEITGEERYLDRAKTLRIDIAINKERGTIDDSRIYVDPLKFSQWFEDNMVSKLTMSLDNLLISNSSTMKLDWSNKNLGASIGDDVIENLLICYNEFCENKVFGIASYLGRRIRHGTFKGTAMTELYDVPKKDEYKSLFEDKEFKRKFDEWMTRYEGMIEDLVKTSLQIKSKKKPMGLITTEIDSQVKIAIAKQLVVNILAIYSKRSGVLRLPSLIIDYLWRLAETDLHKTKKLLSEKKSTYGVFNFNAKHHSQSMKKTISKFTQEINSLTGQKFGLMSSWFNKPNYASPSTDIYLLFNTVVSEVKDRVSHFDPFVDLGESSFSINGGTYYVIYDSLYVLIHNAAIHGKPNGQIHFYVSPCSDRNALKINLKTEVSNLYELNEANERVSSLLHENDDDAHVVEGNSGIKKLKKLEREGSISNIMFKANENDLTLCFEYLFELNSRGDYDLDS